MSGWHGPRSEDGRFLSRREEVKDMVASYWDHRAVEEARSLVEIFGKDGYEAFVDSLPEKGSSDPHSITLELRAALLVVLVHPGIKPEDIVNLINTVPQPVSQ